MRSRPPRTYSPLKVVVVGVMSLALSGSLGSWANPRSSSPVSAVTAETISPRLSAAAGDQATNAVSTLEERPRGRMPRAPKRVVAAKKGVSLWPTANVAHALRRSGSTWFWNWDSAARGVGAPGVEFVPTLWGSGSVTPTRLAEVRRGGSKHLLAFNEPDHADQSNMTVEQALDLWPQLEATGLRLGSPAVAEGGAVAGGWLDRFLTGARARGLRVDFIALHWYGSDFDTPRATTQLRDYVTSVHDRYGLPVWLTEYGLIDYQDGLSYPRRSVQAAFVTSSTRMLESLSFVQRYAWFALPAQGQWRRTGLFRPDLTPTLPGRAYAAAGRRR